MLTPLASATITGSPTFYRGCTYEAANEAIIVDTGSILRRFSLATYNQTASSAISANCAGVALISGASAVMCHSSGSIVSYYEISTGYVQTLVAPSNSTNGKNQIIAGDPTTGVAMYVTSLSGNTLVRVSSSFSATNIAVPLYSSGDAGFSCIINKSSGRWYAGGLSGAIYELDSSGNILDHFMPSINNQGMAFANTTNGSNAYISNMAYDNNILAVGYFDGTTLFFDTTTRTEIYQHSARSTSSTNGTLLTTASGELFGIYHGVSNPGDVVWEADMSLNPMMVYGNIHTGSTGTPQDIGVSTTSSRGWWLQPNSSSVATITFFSVSGVRPTTTRTITVTSGGVDQKARVLLVDSASAVGRPYLDTYMQSPATYRVPTGKTIIELVKIGEGETATWDCSQYST
jgi:hypothetical protein